jgi:signal peptidase I
LPPSLVASIALGGFLAVVLALYIAFSFNYQTIHALGPSMEPAVSNNDYLLLSKTAYRTGAPERGDIVVFHPSNGPTNAYIK